MHVQGISGSVPHPKKPEIISAAVQRIRQGDSLQQIASAHGISAVCLRQWLLALGSEYQQAQQDYIDSALAHSIEEIENRQVEVINAEDQLSLARARELLNIANSRFKAHSWLAERRDKRYAAKQELTIEHINMSDAISKGRARARLIEGEACLIAEQEIE